MQKPNVFISYSHRDKQQVIKIVQDISPYLGHIWVDYKDIIPGQYWDDEIEKGIHQADVVLAMLSVNTVVSPNCKDEYDMAMRWNKPIIPILVQNFDTNKLLWMRIGRKQWIDLSTDYYNGIQLLIKSIGHYTNTPIKTLKTCFICDSSSQIDGSHCPNCGTVYKPQTLSDIHKLNQIQLQTYLQKLAPQISNTTANKDDLLAGAIICIGLKSYDMALSYIQSALRLEQSSAYAWYLQAVSLLKGKRPKLLTRDNALLVQEYAHRAYQYDSTQSHFVFFLALLKSDYFQRNGFKIDNPSIATCLSIASQGNIVVGELKMLLIHIPAQGDTIYSLVERLVLGRS